MAPSTTLIPKANSLNCLTNLKRVLIVDSSLFTNQLYDYLVEQEKEVKLVSNPQKTLDHLMAEFEPDLLFLNLDLFSEDPFEIESLKKKLQKSIVFLLIEPNEEEKFFRASSKFGNSGFLIREETNLQVFPLVLYQAYQKKKLDEKVRFLEHALKETRNLLSEKNLELNLEKENKSEFIKKLSISLQRPLDQLVQFTHICLQRMHRKQFTQLGHYLSEIKLITEEMGTYIQDLKEVALLKAGESPFQLEEVDMVEFLRTIKRQFQPIADSRDITLNFQNHAAHPCVIADFNKLSKVFNILIRNIFKRLPEGEELKLRTFERHSFFEIFIEDTSWVLQEDPGEQIFNVFNAPKLANEWKIMGFSLAVCKELMQGQRGDIRLEADDCSKGARFIVKIPLSKTLF